MAEILLVDEPDILASCTDMLTENGYECRGVSCCHDAMRSLMANRPDLVVLNPHLGAGDGVRTLEAIREFDPDVCVVLYTGASLFGDTFGYFLADRTIMRQDDHCRLLSYVNSKFDYGTTEPDAKTPKFHVGVF